MKVINLYFILLLAVITSISLFGLKTIKEMDSLLTDSVDVYKNPRYCIQSLEKELFDIRYRMAAVTSKSLAFAQVNYNFVDSLEKIEVIFESCTEWKERSMKYISEFDNSSQFDFLDTLVSNFEKHSGFWDNLKIAYDEKDISAVQALYSYKWPYVYHDLVLPLKDFHLIVDYAFESSLRESLHLKKVFLKFWIASGVVFFIITILIYLKVMRVFSQNDEMNREQMSMSKIVMIGEMASSIVHEINNPLSVIQMNGQILKKQIAKDPEHYSKAVSTIPESLLSGVDRISKIIAGLKNFAYQGDGRADEKEILAVCQVIDDSLFFTNHKMRKRNIDFEFIRAEREVTTKGAMIQLSQVFVNLINNASDAVQNLEEKWIRVEVLASDKSKEIEVRITDSGKGIPDDLREKIFQTFYTTKERGKGTGLGLSISQKILSAHDGRIDIDSSCPNTCFQVFLPLVRQIESQLETPPTV